MIQANLNHISPQILQKLNALAVQQNMSVEVYHEQVLDFWIEFANRWVNFNPTANTASPLKVQEVLTEPQLTIPNLQQAIDNTPSFLQHLLAMPAIEGHDDLFERNDEAREIDVDDLDFGETL
ncbi:MULTISPECIES: hypothetical protein [unclassified Moraxella]|uniref:hypothetical protein n=1 Tax=unclassified Moraxella TaxID=2685852 RepID=UPI003AF456B8